MPAIPIRPDMCPIMPGIWDFEIRSAQHFALGCVARHVEELDLIDGLEVRLIRELPHDLFVAREFEDVRLLAKVTVPKVIAENRVDIDIVLLQTRF